ncbi:MFS transporter [Chitinasiproducens palmae]|uniref:MFS transporter n=1 Tax=Chitinasiproducens palmae TaxID=1770053 RepID=UPI001F34DEF0|nr:MFS transporter [Chitinasiproducens palmae]
MESLDTAVAQRPNAQRSERYAWRVLSVTTLGVLLCFVNASTLNVALPVLVRSLHASPAQASWILLSYMLVTTALILIFGRLADLIGRRRLYLLGLAVLVVGSAGCAASPTIEVLLACRCIQAVGAAAVITNTTALLTDAFPTRQLGLALGLNATVSAAAQGLGPIFGGLIVTHFDWRAIFIVNLPLGVVALAWARRSLRETRPRSTERFDFAGAVLSCLALGAIVYALSMGGPQGWGSRRVGVAGGIGLLALAAFLMHQAREPEPLVDLRLVRDGVRATAYALVTIVAFTQISGILLTTLLLQAAHGSSPSAAGLAVAPSPIGMMLASPLAARLTSRYHGLTICTVALAVCMTALLVLASCAARADPYAGLMTGMFLLGGGAGLFLTPNTQTIMHSAPPSQRGIANGIRSTLQNTGFATGSALALSVATAPLTASRQRSVYSGQLSALSAQDIAAFIGGCRAAYAMLAGVIVIGLIIAGISWQRHARHRC